MGNRTKNLLSQELFTNVLKYAINKKASIIVKPSSSKY